MPPFVLFFPLAAVDAIVVGCGWLLALSYDAPQGFAAFLIDWHRRELLFGFLPSAMAGFFLTALPRWTNRPLHPLARWLIFGLWLLARMAAAFPPRFAPLASVPAIALSIVILRHVVVSRDWRNATTAALLSLFSLAGLASTLSAPGDRDATLRVAYCAAVGLIAVIGGRVLPALTRHFYLHAGAVREIRRSSAVEAFSYLSLGPGAIAWVFAADQNLCAAPLMLAAIGQASRVRGWTGLSAAAAPQLRMLYAAYACLPGGFVLAAVHAAAPVFVPADAAAHVWLVGGVGGMVLAIMSSMTRKRFGRPFIVTRASSAASLAWVGALVCRLYGAWALTPAPWLTAAAAAWIAAFALFLADFRALTLRR
jgi:uncharacterized protein involved in response to NO